MSKFDRYLPEKLITALAKLANAKSQNWWREILGNPDLHLAIRNGYLNVYAKGQSVFKIELRDDERPLMTTHYKYLLKPKMSAGKEYVSFDGDKFLAGKQPIDPSLFIQNSYAPGKTISELTRTAVSYSNPEKAGVHIIARENPDVIDMEIAFGSVSDPEDPAPAAELDGEAAKPTFSARRIDLAALRADGNGRASLVFYEAKRFDDARLWGEKPEVLKQMKRYDKFLNENEAVLKSAYVNACKAIVLLREAEGTRSVSTLVRDVSLGRRELAIDKTCRLVIFGFDRDQQKGRLKQLEKVLGLANPMIARGSPKGLRLSAKG